MLTLVTLTALEDFDARTWRTSFLILTALTALLTVPFMLPENWLNQLGRVGEILLNRRTGAYASAVFRVFSLSAALLGGGAMLFILCKKPRFAVTVALTCAVARHAIRGLHRRQRREPAFRRRNGRRWHVYALRNRRTDASSRRNAGYGYLAAHRLRQKNPQLRASARGKQFDRVHQSALLDRRALCVDGGLRLRRIHHRLPAGCGAALRAFLSVTAYYQLDDTPAPDGFVFDHDENGVAVYRNPNALPMGFLQTVCTGAHHQRMDSSTVPVVMLAAVTLSDDDLAAYQGRMQTLDVYNIPDWQESVARLKWNACDGFDTTANSFIAHINAKEAGMLVFTIPFDKGFSATVDGQKAEIVNCDVAFMGVWVEPGEHEIVFTYRTRGLTLGLLMSLAAALMLTVYTFMTRRRGM